MHFPEGLENTPFKLKVLNYSRNCSLHATLIPNLMKPLTDILTNPKRTTKRFLTDFCFLCEIFTYRCGSLLTQCCCFQSISFCLVVLSTWPSMYVFSTYFLTVLRCHTIRFNRTVFNSKLLRTFFHLESFACITETTSNNVKFYFST